MKDKELEQNLCWKMRIWAKKNNCMCEEADTSEHLQTARGGKIRTITGHFCTWKKENLGCGAAHTSPPPAQHSRPNAPAHLKSPASLHQPVGDVAPRGLTGSYDLHHLEGRQKELVRERICWQVSPAQHTCVRSHPEGPQSHSTGQPLGAGGGSLGPVSQPLVPQAARTVPRAICWPEACLAYTSQSNPEQLLYLNENLLVSGVLQHRATAAPAQPTGHCSLTPASFLPVLALSRSTGPQDPQPVSSGAGSPSAYCKESRRSFTSTTSTWPRFPLVLRPGTATRSKQ